VKRPSVPTGLSGCPECGGTGWVHVSKDGVPGVVRCDCFRHSRIQRLISNARIPERYTHCELQNFETDLQNAETKQKLTTKSIDLAKIVAERFVDDYPAAGPVGLLFMGPPGIGKTHLAVGIIQALIRRKAVRCMFRAFPELLKEIQMSYSPISESSELSLLSPVLETEVLVLDELGAQTPSTWVKDTVSYILNNRYSENKVTIFTTNYLDHDEPMDTRKGVFYSLRDRIGDQMRSRLYEMCKVVPMKGEDFRMHVKQAAPHLRRGF
jgi:DNA replication protein DnaC